jgi:insertion element IS1 protein InsB
VVIEADELWSFVGSKANPQWIWVALDAATRRVLAVVVGDRSEFAARCLWLSLPDEYRERAVFHTDFLPAYRAVIPDGQHVPGGKGDGGTSHVERFWCTVRQRCARFVRKTLSFSKCLENHLGALWFFIHQYNQSH